MTDPNEPPAPPSEDLRPSEPETPSAESADPIPAPEGPTEHLETDYEIGQDNIHIRRRFVLELDVHNVVFVVSAVFIVALTATAMIFQSALYPLFEGLRDVLINTLDWFLLAAGNVFVLVCLALIVLPLGRVRLGGPEARPDYSAVSWLSMLFAAGMGIGLMFYGVAEPLGHFTASFEGPTVGPEGARTDFAPLEGTPGDALGARRLAMAATILHWALHPWSMYAVVALSLALFAFNKGLPMTLRSVFYPLLGERVWGWPGHLIDILSIFATLFGLATSLGIGAQQAAAGLHFLFGYTRGTGGIVLLIVVITGIAVGSVVAGMDKGVKRLSQLNMLLAMVLLVFVIVVGPTLQIFTGFFANLRAYVEHLPALSNPFGRTDDNFRREWTAFYWAWWISWSPFVGLFIARVSRGRTVRQFLLAMLFIPSLVSSIWMTALGGTAISQVINQGRTVVQDAPLELKLFEMLAALPLTSIASFIGIVLVIVFFVTSSDSGSIVIDTIASGGKVATPILQRVFWASFEGFIALALLLGGGLAALQAMTVSTGIPFAAVLLVASASLIKGLMGEPREGRGRAPREG